MEVIPGSRKGVFLRGGALFIAFQIMLPTLRSFLSQEMLVKFEQWSNGPLVGRRAALGGGEVPAASRPRRQ